MPSGIAESENLKKAGIVYIKKKKMLDIIQDFGKSPITMTQCDDRSKAILMLACVASLENDGNLNFSIDYM